MPPRRAVRLGTGRGARGAARGAARGVARGAARGGRGTRMGDNTDSLVGGEEHSVEQQNSGVNLGVEPEVVVPTAGQDAELQSKLFDRFLKRNPPKFSGVETPIQAIEFLRDLEGIFGPMGINGPLRTTFAAYMLRGGARDWWENAHRSLVAAGRTPVFWDQFVELFRESFCLRVQMNAMERELIQLQQGDRSVTEYERRFSDLCRLLPEVHATEGKRIERFRDGMNWEIRIRTSLKQYVSFHELVNDALHVEMELAERPVGVEKKGRYDVSGMGGPSNSGFQGRSVQPDQLSQSQFSVPAANSQIGVPVSMPRSLSGFERDSRGRQSNVGCFRCGKLDHKAKECHVRVRHCYRCRRGGHLAANCPQRQSTGVGVSTFAPGSLQGNRGGRFNGIEGDGREARPSQGANPPE